MLLTIGCVFGVLALIPYALHIQSAQLEQTKPPMPLWLLILLQLAQNTVLFGFMGFLGLYLADRTGFEQPILEDMVSGNQWMKKYLNQLPQAILLGVIASVFIILLDVFVFMGAQASAQEMHISTPPWWKGLLASFYGAINEEVFARLFLISLIVFLTQKILKRKTDEPTEYVIWMAIGLSSVLFGLGHLPATLSAGIPLNYFIVVRAIVLNSIAAIPFGWLYWKKSLAAAMSAHFTADIVLHVLLPLAAAG